MPPTVHVHIDGQPVTSPKARVTGAELRALTSPPPTSIWLDLPDAQDQLVADDQVIRLSDGDRFFTDRARMIHLNGVAYQVPSSVITEIAIRQLATPPIGADQGVWRDVVDDLDDPLAPGEIVRIAEGDRFFSKPMPHREIGIIVNGRRRTVRTVSVGYEQIVKIAFPDVQPGENVTYSVIYSNAVKPKHEGTLAEGGRVIVKEGTRFRVSQTDKS